MQENNLTYTSILDVGVWSGLIPNLNTDQLIKELYHLKNTVPPATKSNNGGYQTKDNLHLFSQFFPLVQIINNIGIEFTSNPNIKINSLWGNISSFSNFNNLHTHSQTTNPNKISGVIYLKVPKNSGNIIFHNPINPSYTIHFTPKESSILLFPSILAHMVEPNLSKDDRISIAFNYE